MFSLKPGDSPPRVNNTSLIECYDSTNQTFRYIYALWSSTSFKYAIADTVMTDENTITIDLDTTKLNHIVFEFTGQKLIVWANGISRKTHNRPSLGSFSNIKIGAKEVGIVSLYNRDLSKGEIVEHFIENHVKNFTDDEVLI